MYKKCNLKASAIKKNSSERKTKHFNRYHPLSLFYTPITPINTSLRVFSYKRAQEKTKFSKKTASVLCVVRETEGKIKISRTCIKLQQTINSFDFSHSKLKQQNFPLVKEPFTISREA